MTDINRTFRNILKRWGHDVLIQRRLDDDFNYSSKFERVTTRHMYPANSELSNLLREASEGTMADGLEMIYYFDNTVNPRVGDRIYENMQDHPDGDIVYLIDSVIPMRGRRGLIDYWVAGTTKEK